MRLTSLSALLASLVAVASLVACTPQRGSAPGRFALPDSSDTAASDHTVPSDTSLRDSTLHLPPSPAPLAPGTARVTVAAASCIRKSGRAYTCLLRVVRVEGYGPATPPLAAGRTVQARFQEQLLTEETRAVFLKGQGTARVLLRHEGPAPTGQKDKGPYWTVSRIR